MSGDSSRAQSRQHWPPQGDHLGRWGQGVELGSFRMPVKAGVSLD